MHTLTADTDQSATVCRRFTVVGMACGQCEHAIATMIGAISGVTCVLADAAAGTVIVESAGELEVTDVVAAVDGAGCGLAR